MEGFEDIPFVKGPSKKVLLPQLQIQPIQTNLQLDLEFQRPITIHNAITQNTKLINPPHSIDQSNPNHLHKRATSNASQSNPSTLHLFSDSSHQKKLKIQKQVQNFNFGIKGMSGLNIDLNSSKRSADQPSNRSKSKNSETKKTNSFIQNADRFLEKHSNYPFKRVGVADKHPMNFQNVQNTRVQNFAAPKPKRKNSDEIDKRKSKNAFSLIGDSLSGLNLNTERVKKNQKLLNTAKNVIINKMAGVNIFEMGGDLQNMTLKSPPQEEAIPYQECYNQRFSTHVTITDDMIKKFQRVDAVINYFIDKVRTHFHSYLAILSCFQPVSAILTIFSWMILSASLPGLNTFYSTIS